MNKRELERYVKKNLCRDVYFDIEINNKKIYFSLYSFDNRKVCDIEIPYKDRLNKKAIYTAIADLIKNFDFSFRVTFENTEDIYKFLGIKEWN